ncbi:MAG: hypothetical protein KatS3mg082_0033 [Nitrospiraceae bacterium]|nr:MAG: hypothetical protein KatS3mg082_0033 [Nitrospiraceae bacterium]
MSGFRRAGGCCALAAVVAAGLGVAAVALHAKDAGGLPAGIPPEKVADYVHAVIQADRTIYTTMIVNRMQEKGIVSAEEHWEQNNALPLPAQFLQHSGKLVAEGGGGIRYRLISLWPIYQRNAPATPLERKALETVTAQPGSPVHRHRHERPQTIFSGRVRRPRRIEGLRELSQQPPIEPQARLQAERRDGRHCDHDPAGVREGRAECRPEASVRL